MLIRKKSAQSVLEYAVMAGLVVMAIIFGGPVLVRSINAHFKMMDNNTQDAFQERITQVGAPSASLTCQCNPDDPVPATSWPATNCTVGGCDSFSRYHHRQCTPLKCRKEMACVVDAECCKEVVYQTCGTSVLNYVHARVDKRCDSGVRAALNPNFSATPGIKGVCMQGGVDPTATWPYGRIDCPIGERIVMIECGLPPSGSRKYYGCVEDAKCLPDCVARHSVAAVASQECPMSVAVPLDQLYVEVDARLAAAPLDSPQRRWSPFMELEVANGRVFGQDAYRLDMAFLRNAAQCNTAASPVTPRYCERYCIGCTVPNPEGTACMRWNCHDFGGAVGAAQPRGTPASWLIDPADNTPGQYTITAFADSLDFVATCFDANGNISQQSGNRQLFACAVGNAGYIGQQVRGHAYCTGGRNPGTNYAYAQVNCVGVVGFVSVWADAGVGSSANPTIGYQICQQALP